MTRQLNDHHLRLVTVDDPVDLPQSQFVTDWSSLCDAFTTATSIPLNFRAADEEASVAPVAWSTEVPAVGPFAPGTLSLLQKKTRLGKDRVAAIEQLAQQVGDLVYQLHDAQRSLWQREAELMTAIPLVVRPDKEPSQLAARFEAILKCGAEALHCHAAAIYILDDDTRHLKMRAHFGLKHSRLTAPPRPLKSARADVEALAGYAVTLCDSEELAEWDVPEEFEAAICVPISTANVPLGTLWLFSQESVEFTDEQVNIAEIIGSRIAVECEREILLREQGVVGGGGLHMNEAITWQQDSLPGSAA
ncbi:MAG: GAF domain-containing protein, partial [Planctomycetota bacterium]